MNGTFNVQEVYLSYDIHYPFEFPELPQIAEDKPINTTNNVFNLTNLTLSKMDDAYSKLPEAIGQQASINNHAN